VADPTNSNIELVERLIEKVTLRRAAIEITLRSGAEEPLVVEWQPASGARRRVIVPPEPSGSLGRRPIRAEARARLIEGIAKGRVWLDELVSGKVYNTKELAIREGCSERAIRMTLSLAFTNPAITKAAVEGTLPFGSGASRLAELPSCWWAQSRQR
jgi:hypothetical protein